MTSKKQGNASASSRSRSSRRIGAESSHTRAALLDAAEILMRKEGYAAVTSRKLASVAKLTPQLVHYYFRTMDDLFLALWQRFVDKNMARHAQALASAQPARAMWDMFRKSADIALEVEFMALAHHRKAIRTRLARDGDEFRKMQVGLLSRATEDYRLGDDACSAEILTVLLTSISRTIVLEEDLGMSQGHAQTLRYVEEWLARREPSLKPSAPRAEKEKVKRLRSTTKDARA
jgi:TetR/AcrR family transcriptional regulator